MTKRRANLQGGFTLVELMVVVAIIGLLASVALPQYQRAVLRSRAAERSTVLDAIGRAVNDVVANAQRLPTPDPSEVWSGAWNPPAAPTPQKRIFTYTTAGWGFLPMVVQGACYYSYSFDALDPAPKGKTVTMTVRAAGDLDGDTVISTKDVNWTAQGYTFMRVGETPAAGLEDATTF
jgi:prepilin-type N-terminal cleavage/methylation domain-containing protein